MRLENKKGALAWIEDAALGSEFEGKRVASDRVNEIKHVRHDGGKDGNKNAK